MSQKVVLYMSYLLKFSISLLIKCIKVPQSNIYYIVFGAKNCIFMCWNVNLLMLLIIKTSFAQWMNYSMEDWILTSHSIEKSTINRATGTKCLPDRIYMESAINWSSEIWNPSVSVNKPLLPIFDILGIFSLLSALNKSTFQHVFNPLHADVNCRRYVKIFNLCKKNLKFKYLLPYLDSAWKMHSNESKQA